MELAGNFALEGYFPRLAMDCSLWKDLPSLPCLLIGSAENSRTF
jgi:hypothetical protein